jgi:two-component system, chemotaxis family, sensor kinase CheA
VTSRASDADRRRAMDAGADAYLVKGDLDQRTLLEAVGCLLGLAVHPGGAGR